MAVGVIPSPGVAANVADNLCRWDRESPGHYEVWFLTLNERASQRGFWFRYGIEIPQAGVCDANPRVTLWASFFDWSAPEKNFCLARECTVEEFQCKDGQFDIRFPDARLSSWRAKGCIEEAAHRIAWDLHFLPNSRTYHHVPPRVYSLLRPSSFVCSPNLDTRFSGTVQIDGHDLILDNEPGCQSHLWGSKQIDEWVWVHSNAFEKHENTVFEGLAARPRRSGRLLPPIQSLFLRHAGEEHHFLRMRFSEQWQHNLGVGFWSFAAMNTRIYLEGSAHCRLKNMLQLRYTDPDGEPLFCLNSEVANLKIRIFRRVHGMHWRHCETLNACTTAHLEHASRSADTRVPVSS